MIQRLYWKSYTNKDRHSVIFEIQKIVNQFAIILNFNLLSDYSLVLLIETEPEKVTELYDNLNKFIPVTSESNNEVNNGSAKIISLDIRFKSATGELKNIIPELPG